MQVTPIVKLDSSHAYSVAQPFLWSKHLNYKIYNFKFSHDKFSHSIGNQECVVGPMVSMVQSKGTLWIKGSKKSPKKRRRKGLKVITKDFNKIPQESLCPPNFDTEEYICALEYAEIKKELILTQHKQRLVASCMD